MEVPRPSKTCSVSGRELLPGDVFFSILLEENGVMKRSDIGVEHWSAPPSDGPFPDDWIGWWKTRLPEVGEKKFKLAPNDILLTLFEQLRANSEQQDMLYVLTLLLIRRRLLRYEREDENEEGNKILVVYAIKENATYEIPVAMPDRQRLEEVQEKLAQLLYG